MATEKLYIIQYKESDSKMEQVFENRIRSFGSWVKYFDNNYMVRSDLSSRQLYDQLTADFEEASILIMEFKGTNYWGRMSKSVWDIIQDKNTNESETG